MSIASSNAFKGYNFQGTVYSYFVFLMDLQRKIVEVGAEKPVDNNFDDIFVKTKDDSFYFQIKNYSEIKFDDLKFEKDKICISGKADINVKSKSGYKKNILIIKDLLIPEEKISDHLFGLDCYKSSDYYIAGYNEIILDEKIRTMYNDDVRYSGVCNIADNIINSGTFNFEISNLPPLTIFSQKLQEETLIIRNFDISSDSNVLFIVGKPGVGKSHLVNELENQKIISNFVLERLWISEDDKNKKDRRQFNEFIKDLSYNLFNQAEIKSEEEIIEYLKINNKTLIIDGLDHVENYNCEDLNLFLNFIDNIKDSKVIVLTRPLSCKYSYNKIKLNNWTEEETINYIKLRGISDYSICKKIYDISNGYPIITYFLCEHFIIYKDIPDFKLMNDLNDFYDSLIGEAYKGLSVFLLLNNSYFKYSDLEVILTPYEYEMIKDVISTNKYLFSIERDRIYLIHDSLNLYLRTKVPNYLEINKNAIDIICKSLEEENIRFLSRFGCIELPDDFKIKYTKKMCSFEKMMDILDKTIDYEMLTDIVFAFEAVISTNNNDFTIEEHYNYILLCECFSRNNHRGYYELIIERVAYYINNDLINYDNIYSTGLLFHIYSCFVDNSYNPLRKYFANSHYDADGEISSISECFKDRSEYYDIIKNKIDVAKLIKEKIKGSELFDKDLIIKVICYLYIHKEKYKGYEKVTEFIFNNNELEAVNLISKIFIENGIRPFFAKNAIYKIKDYLFSLGVNSKDNYYKHHSLNQIILEHSIDGTDYLSGYISNYIRLASYEKRKIDYGSCKMFYFMYFYEKDYSALNLHVALYVLMKKGYLECNKCVEIIKTFLEMSRKGIRHIMTDFCNLLSDDEFVNVIDDVIDDIQIKDLDPAKINLIKKRIVFNDFFENILGYHSSSRDLSFSGIKSLIKSTFGYEIIDIIRRANFNVDGNMAQSIDFETYSPKEDYEKKKFTERDWIYEDDEQELLDNNISCSELAKYTDGWENSLPYVNLFAIYEKNEVQDNMKNIIVNASFNVLNKYGNYTRYLMLGNVLKILYEYDYNKVNWDQLYSSFITFVEFSINKKIA